MADARRRGRLAAVLLCSSLALLGTAGVQAQYDEEDDQEKAQNHGQHAWTQLSA